MKEVSGPFGSELSCIPYEDQHLEDLLSNAIQNIHAEITAYEMDELSQEDEDKSIPALPTVRNFSYAVVEGTIYYRENSRMMPVDVSATAASRIKGLIAIRDCVRQLIEYQTEDFPESFITAEQKKLNELYDAFSKKYGLINSRANTSAFNADSSYCLLASLEILDDEGNFVRKADMMNGLAPTVYPATTKPFSPIWEVIPFMHTAWTAPTPLFGWNATWPLSMAVRTVGRWNGAMSWRMI